MSTILTVTAVIIGILFLMVYIMYLQGKKLDMTPNGFGEFGYDVTNPIPFKDIPGSIAYLDILKTKAGQPVKYNRLGSTRTNNIENLIDIYEILVQGQKIATLYISPYQEHNSSKAPKDFIL